MCSAPPLPLPPVRTQRDHGRALTSGSSSQHKLRILRSSVRVLPAPSARCEAVEKPRLSPPLPCPRPAPESFAPPCPGTRVPPGGTPELRAPLDQACGGEKGISPSSSRDFAPTSRNAASDHPPAKLRGAGAPTCLTGCVLEADVLCARGDAGFTPPAAAVLVADGSRFSKDLGFQWV